MADNLWILNDSIPISIAQQFEPAIEIVSGICGHSGSMADVFQPINQPWQFDYWGGPTTILFPAVVGETIAGIVGHSSLCSDKVEAVETDVGSCRHAGLAFDAIDALDSAVGVLGCSGDIHAILDIPETIGCVSGCSSSIADTVELINLDNGILGHAGSIVDVAEYLDAGTGVIVHRGFGTDLADSVESVIGIIGQQSSILDSPEITGSIECVSGHSGFSSDLADSVDSSSCVLGHQSIISDFSEVSGAALGIIGHSGSIQDEQAKLGQTTPWVYRRRIRIIYEEKCLATSRLSSSLLGNLILAEAVSSRFKSSALLGDGVESNETIKLAKKINASLSGNVDFIVVSAFASKSHVKLSDEKDRRSDILFGEDSWLFEMMEEEALVFA